MRPTARLVGAGLLVVGAVTSPAVAAVVSPAGGPLRLVNGTAAGGYPLDGGDPQGERIRFINRGTFWIAVLVQNRALQPVTIVGARTREPVNSLARQTRAGFSGYTPCTGNRFCPWPSAPTSTKPLVLPPKAEAAVKLNYQLVSCAQAGGSTTASASTLVLDYRYGNGGIQHETAPLGGSKLLLERPAGVECLPRPYSYIGLVGSFTTSPEHKPIPGSDGDMCAKTATRGLNFRSRQFMDRSGVVFRIEISLPRYRGIGSYRHSGQTLGPADVTAIGEFGTPGPTTIFHDPNASVTVTAARGTTIGGRLTAVFSGHRRFFRAYGAWRCTTRR